VSLPRARLSSRVVRKTRKRQSPGACCLGLQSFESAVPGIPLLPEPFAGRVEVAERVWCWIIGPCSATGDAEYSRRSARRRRFVSAGFADESAVSTARTS
jgi:hypothetical protein